MPVGVCNTSHDVLELALEQGLPEVSALFGCVMAAVSAGTDHVSNAEDPRRCWLLSGD